MKLRTSFFNTTVLKKDITRFAPAWALYLTGMLLIMVGIFASSETDAKDLASDMNVTISILSIVNLCYALLAAQLLFGDLFNSRLCNALHAMPLRREGWFLTHLTSGLLFSIVPNLIVGLCLIPSLDYYFSVAFIWVGCLTLQYLFFFGTAVMSAMCTGNRFAMTLVYGIINFLSMIVFWILMFLYEPLMPGISIDADPLRIFSPAWYLCSRELRYTPEALLPDYYRGSVNGVPYLLGIGLIGIGAMVLALVLYRRRQLESAGDFITVKPLAPVFSVLYTLIAGIILYLFTQIFGTDTVGYIFLAVGIVIGSITGQMLLKRTVKVFQAKTFISMAVIAAVVFGSLWMTSADVLGIVRWQPNPSEVQSVSVSTYYDDSYYTTTDPAEIQELIDIHGNILEDFTDSNKYTTLVKLNYRLTNGKTVTRSYFCPMSEETAQALNPYMSKPEMVMRYGDWEVFRESIEYVTFCYLDDVTFYGEEARTLADAIKADCEAGTMNQEWIMNDKYDQASIVEISARGEDGKGDVFRSVSIWDRCEHTLAWMEEHGVKWDG